METRETVWDTNDSLKKKLWTYVTLLSRVKCQSSAKTDQLHSQTETRCRCEPKLRSKVEQLNQEKQALLRTITVMSKHIGTREADEINSLKKNIKHLEERNGNLELLAQINSPRAVANKDPSGSKHNSNSWQQWLENCSK